MVHTHVMSLAVTRCSTSHTNSSIINDIIRKITNALTQTVARDSGPRHIFSDMSMIDMRERKSSTALCKAATTQGKGERDSLARITGNDI